MAYITGTLDTETKGNVSSELAITTETIITLDIILATGTHDKSRCELQHSPDGGTTWFSCLDSTNGTGSVTCTLATSRVRASVILGEDSAATATYFITTK